MTSIHPTSKTIDNLLIYCQVLFIILGFIWLIQYFHTVILFDHTGLVSGGILSGGLHALTGPDHLAALLPSIVGKRWFIAFLFGCLWGFGHSFSSSFMATCGYFLEDSVLRLTFMNYVIQFADFAIGCTLIVIGSLGIYESFHSNEHSNEHSTEYKIDHVVDDTRQHINDQRNNNLSSNTILSSEKSIGFQSFPTRLSFNIYLLMKFFAISSTIFLNGLLLGLSWDGLPSLAPALSADSWQELLTFLISYGIGTMLSMGIASAMIGFCTQWLGRYTYDSIPKHLAYSTSILAIVIGILWIGQASIRIVAIDDHSQNVLSYMGNRLIATGTPIVVVVVILITLGKEYMCCNNISIVSATSSKQSNQSILPIIKSDIHIV